MCVRVQGFQHLYLSEEDHAALQAMALQAGTGGPLFRTYACTHGGMYAHMEVET